MKGIENRERVESETVEYIELETFRGMFFVSTYSIVPYSLSFLYGRYS